jgi:hypothetical protein
MMFKRVGGLGMEIWEKKEGIAESNSYNLV